ncbi:uncharacterized protein LTR77_010986 [Saxophila tyrrhenica]|uniref:Uncharacterized protein n=1 Tax=Saxophila tyrrhenica TaxID=1690608 RepID=A0AAV9NXG1_9PEZI|nr:hypothetical protein LTR77_010986 [Saxophila tyrrhenica]
MTNKRPEGPLRELHKDVPNFVEIENTSIRVWLKVEAWVVPGNDFVDQYYWTFRLQVDTRSTGDLSTERLNGLIAEAGKCQRMLHQTQEWTFRMEEIEYVDRKRGIDASNHDSLRMEENPRKVSKRTPGSIAKSHPRNLGLGNWELQSVMVGPGMFEPSASSRVAHDINPPRLEATQPSGSTPGVAGVGLAGRNSLALTSGIGRSGSTAPDHSTSTDPPYYGRRDPDDLQLTDADHPGLTYDVDVSRPTDDDPSGLMPAVGLSELASTDLSILTSDADATGPTGMHSPELTPGVGPLELASVDTTGPTPGVDSSGLTDDGSRGQDVSRLIHNAGPARPANIASSEVTVIVEPTGVAPDIDPLQHLDIDPMTDEEWQTLQALYASGPTDGADQAGPVATDPSRLTPGVDPSRLADPGAPEPTSDEEQSGIRGTSASELTSALYWSGRTGTDPPAQPSSGRPPTVSGAHSSALAPVEHPSGPDHSETPHVLNPSGPTPESLDADDAGRRNEDWPMQDVATAEQGGPPNIQHAITDIQRTHSVGTEQQDPSGDGHSSADRTDLLPHGNPKKRMSSAGGTAPGPTAVKRKIAVPQPRGTRSLSGVSSRGEGEGGIAGSGATPDQCREQGMASPADRPAVFCGTTFARRVRVLVNAVITGAAKFQADEISRGTWMKGSGMKLERCADAQALNETYSKQVEAASTNQWRLYFFFGCSEQILSASRGRSSRQISCSAGQSEGGPVPVSGPNSPPSSSDGGGHSENKSKRFRCRKIARIVISLINSLAAALELEGAEAGDGAQRAYNIIPALAVANHGFSQSKIGDWKTENIQAGVAQAAEALMRPEHSEWRYLDQAFRIDPAVRLKTTDMSIAQVRERLGLNQSSSQRLFNEYTNMDETPSNDGQPEDTDEEL